MVAGGVPYTDDEVQEMRREYPKAGMAGIQKVVARHGEGAVKKKLKRIGVRRDGGAAKRPWTPAGDDRLSVAWSSGFSPDKLVAMFPGRGWRAICEHAYDLGLPPLPKGYVSIKGAAEAINRGEKFVLALAKWASVRVDLRRSLDPERKKKSQRKIVELAALKAALVEWDDSEWIREAAAARGMGAPLLKGLIIASGLVRAPKRGRRLRVKTKVLDFVVAKYKDAKNARRSRHGRGPDSSGGVGVVTCSSAR